MIVVTGGEGFIGKNLVAELQRRGNIGVISLDIKSETLELIYHWLIEHEKEIDIIYHIGAINDTMKMDKNLFDKYNVECSMFIWNLCTYNQIPLIYSSSAATYGDGEEGFDDEKDIVNLTPLNPYGWSKQQFDIWVETQEKCPSCWYGLKFFNVYGYNEAPKNRMASVIFHFYNQIISDGLVKLFDADQPEYKHGEQKRDFVYVDDVVDVCIFMGIEKPASGIYNVGTGKARSFNDAAKTIFKTLAKPEKISYIGMPSGLKERYQYFTEAKINKLKGVDYKKPFTELEDGILKYINKINDKTC